MWDWKYLLGPIGGAAAASQHGENPFAGMLDSFTDGLFHIGTHGQKPQGLGSIAPQDPAKTWDPSWGQNPYVHPMAQMQGQPQGQQLPGQHLPFQPPRGSF